MTGFVKTKALDKDYIESGTVAVIEDDHCLKLCTLLHMSPKSEWVVETADGFELTLKEFEPCKLIVEDTLGAQYSLKFNQWKKSLANNEVNNPDKPVMFELATSKFKPGKYVNTCSDCYGHFLGGKTQPICEKCNEKTTSAKIIINKNTVKRKRPRMITQQKAASLMTEAYNMGANGKPPKEYFAWLKNIF